MHRLREVGMLTWIYYVKLKIPGRPLFTTKMIPVLVTGSSRSLAMPVVCGPGHNSKRRHSCKTRLLEGPEKSKISK